MDQILEKLGWKKLSALIIIVTIIFLFMLFLSFANSDTGRIVQNKITNSSNDKIKNQFPNTSLKSYSNSYYSISYPADFELVPLNSSSGVLDDVKFTSKPTGSEISVVVFDKFSNSIDSLSALYNNKNFSKEVKAQGGYQSIYFSGGFSAEHHQKVFLLQKNTVVIRVLLSYSGAANDTLDNSFDMMSQSLK